MACLAKKGVWVCVGWDIPVLNSRALMGPAWAGPLAQDSTTDSLSASWGPLAPCAVATAEGEEWADACARAYACVQRAHDGVHTDAAVANMQCASQASTHGEQKQKLTMSA